MASALVLDLREEGGALRVEVKGAITEAAEFGPVLSTQTPRVHIDLSGVARINSSGVREWIRFIRQASAARQVILERCSPAMVRQFNMIANAAGAATVASLMLPYHCKACDADRTIVLDVLDGPALIHETAPCPDCAAPMEFDDLSDGYLSFLARRGQPSGAT